MNPSIVFFDIDGTIWDYKEGIPTSTIQGIRELRANGHLAFLCSGRTRSTIRAKELLDIGFDGIIAGCGTYIEYNNQVLLNELMPWDTLQDLLPAMEEKGIHPFLEGCDKLYIEWKYYKGAMYAESFRKSLGKDCLDVTELTPDCRINKISIEYENIPHEEVIDFFGKDYNTIIHDFTGPNGEPINVAEIIPQGRSKAMGIKWICKHLGISRDNTYAFGDSANDIDMLQYVKTGIAMGNASKITKENADYVTSSMYEDGIYNGLKYAGLI